MKIFLNVLLMIFLVGCSNLTDKTKTIPRDISRGDFSFYDQFDGNMKEKVSKEELETIWKGLVAEIGSFCDVIGVKTEDKHIVLTCQFEKAVFDISFRYDDDEKICGFFFSSAVENTYEPPEYVDKSLFTEEEVVIGQGKWVLPGTLSLPKGGSNFRYC